MAATQAEQGIDLFLAALADTVSWLEGQSQAPDRQAFLVQLGSDIDSHVSARKAVPAVWSSSQACFETVLSYAGLGKTILPES